MSTLSRQQRRRLDRLAREAEPTIEADARFFVRGKDRSYRVRRAHWAEVEAFALLGSTGLHPDDAWFVAVRQVAPGVRLRHPISGPKATDPDCFSECECIWTYEHAIRNSPEKTQIEASLDKAFGGQK